MSQQGDRAFVGSIPAIYERYLGPLIFEPYARDLARRAQRLGPRRILETASGTGIATRALAHALPEAGIVASDLNQPMLDFAATLLTSPRITFRQADALSLPFGAGDFDLVVCQFGVMFFPDRIAGMREALRVLRPGGTFLFSVWAELAANPFTLEVHEAIAARYPKDPPSFLARTPHGHHDTALLRRELAAAGFFGTNVETVTLTCRAASARDVAAGFCQGSPLRGEILARDPDGLEGATEAATAALRRRFGDGEITGPISAHVLAARAQASA